MLLVVYFALSLLNDDRAYLGTDTGGKVATLEVMAERGRLDPDIGYWAEEWDPDGLVHPLYYTSRVGDRWVNATTVPMLYAGYPLYRLGGYRLALLLPMAGSVLAALAGRALARRLSGGDGWAAFWIVGLASPITIYALDFWEHSLGVAAMVWALVALLDVVEGRRSTWWALAAGALFGGAATVRTEALVYAFVAVGLACLVLWLGKGRFSAAVVAGALAVVGLGIPVAANAALEAGTVGDTVRTGRVAGRASDTVTQTSDRQERRMNEAALNAVALTPRQEQASYLVGLALLGLLAFIALRVSRTDDSGPAVIAAIGAAVLYLVRFSEGPGFVPSLIAATPIAAAGLVLGWTSFAGRYLLGVGLASLPIVWATQFLGGAAPQWAGRYILVSGLLFGVTGIVALPRLRPWAARTFIGMAVVVTAFGLIWTSIRTNDFAAALSALSRRPEPVLVSRVGHLAREGGAFYLDSRWLTATSDAEQDFAVGVLEKAGVTQFALVELQEAGDTDAPDGWREIGRDDLRLVNETRLRVTSFEVE